MAAAYKAPRHTATPEAGLSFAIRTATAATAFAPAALTASTPRPALKVRTTACRTVLTPGLWKRPCGGFTAAECKAPAAWPPTEARLRCGFRRGGSSGHHP